MKVKSFCLSILAVFLLLSLSSCASLSKKRAASDGESTIPIKPQNIEVVGPVRAEVNAYSVLGFPPGQHSNFAVFSWGGNAYDQLLEQAYELGAHDVINISVDYEDISFFFLFNRRRFVVNGLAVLYTGEMQ